MPQQSEENSETLSSELRGGNITGSAIKTARSRLKTLRTGEDPGPGFSLGGEAPGFSFLEQENASSGERRHPLLHDSHVTGGGRLHNDTYMTP